MIEKYLVQAGLNKTESEIYLSLFEHQRLTPLAIAKVTGIKRTTVYAAADELVKKGLANLVHGKNKRFYLVESSENLLKYIQKEEKNLLLRKKAAEQAIEEMKKIPRSKAISTPKIRIVNDLNISDFLYKQTPIWEESMLEKKETTWWGFHSTDFIENEEYQKWILWYWKRAPKKIDLKLLTNNEKIEEEMKKFKLKKRKIKFFEGEEMITGNQWILGDYIVSVVSDTKSPYLIQTHDPVMAQNLRELYKYIWRKHEK